MSGIYIHIPFCKKACHYCDFHFSTSLQYKSEMVAAILNEIAIRKDYLSGEKIETVYFGGGTPSLLEADEINKIIDQIQKHYQLQPDAEITLEANPDDLHLAKVASLRTTPVNRFSIGIQSFFDEDLRWMNRSHNAAEAESSIKRVQDAGFENITADLIYGYPLLSDAKWLQNIQKMIDIAVAHLSCYALTVEQGTALHNFIQKGKQQNINDTQSAEQFILLMELLHKAGFIHYEISNFARPGQESKHNSNYWKRSNYLGIGASAHSFNGLSRQWNIANNAQYMSALQFDKIPATIEQLTLNNRFNEYMMTALRTIWGVDLMYISLEFGENYMQSLNDKIADFSNKNWVKTHDQKLTLTQEGKLFADHIASEFFIIDHDE